MAKRTISPMSMATLHKRMLAKARYRSQVVRANQPGRPPQPTYTKKEFLEALQGTGGVKARIAENLGCSYGTVGNLLRRPDWADMLEAFNDEVECGVDLAQQTIMDAMRQRLDMGVASNTARWYLSHMRRDQFADKTIIEGGANPIKVVQANIDVDTLNLPIEMKRQLLLAMDNKDEQQRLLEERKAVPGIIPVGVKVRRAVASKVVATTPIVKSQTAQGPDEDEDE